MNSDMNDGIFSFILKDCVVSCLKQDLCKLGYINTVIVPFQSLANGFQSEARFAHGADILFVHFKSMFLA